MSKWILIFTFSKNVVTQIMTYVQDFVHKKLQLLDFSKCLAERYHLDICKLLITFEKSSVLKFKDVKHYSKMNNLYS